MRASLALALAVLLGATAASAAADTETVSPPGRAAEIAAAGNERGDAVVVFRGRGNSLYVAFASRGGRFGRPKRVPGGRIGQYTIGGTRVAVDERGDAMIAWTSFDNSRPEEPDARDEGCCLRVRALIRRRSGRLTRVRTINPRGHGSSITGLDASGGRFGAVWATYEGGANGLAVGGRAGRFGSRLAVRGQATPYALALSARRILVHGVRSEVRGPKLVALRYDGRRPRRARRRLVRGTGAIGFDARILSTVGGAILGLQPQYRRRDRPWVVTGAGSRARMIRDRYYGGIALASSGRGVLAGRSGSSIVLRRRHPDGTLSTRARHRVGRSVRVAGAAINRAGDPAIAYRVGQRRFGVLVGARRRTVTRRGDRFGRNPVHIDARGRVRLLYVRRGRLRAWRG